MEIVDLLAIFSDPLRIKELSTTQRLLAGLVTTLLGMGITFIALVILQLVTSFFDKLSPVKKNEIKMSSPPVETDIPASQPSQQDHLDESGQHVAAISVALAVMLEKPASEIVISSIRKIDDPVPAWSRAGINEQVHNSV